jgi:hypothetical protein
MPCSRRRLGTVDLDFDHGPSDSRSISSLRQGVSSF